MSLSMVPKLKGNSNFYAWETALKGACLWEDSALWGVLIGRIPKSATDDDESENLGGLDSNEYAFLVERLEGALLLTLEHGPQYELKSVKTAPEKYQTLKRLYGTPHTEAIDLAWADIRDSSMAQFHSIAEYTNFFKKSHAKLQDMGQFVKPSLLWTFYRQGLGRRDDSESSKELDTIAWRETGLTKTPPTPESPPPFQEISDP